MHAVLYEKGRRGLIVGDEKVIELVNDVCVRGNSAPEGSKPKENVREVGAGALEEKVGVVVDGYRGAAGVGPALKREVVA